MENITIKNFNNVAENGQILSPLPASYPDVELTDTVKAFTDEKINEIEGESSLSKKWNFNDIINADDNSFKSIYLAASTVGKISRLLIDYKNMLAKSGPGENNQTQWKNATILKTSYTLKDLLTENIEHALEEIKEQGFLSDDRNQELVELSVNASYANEEMIKSILNFMEQNPDPEYDSGQKQDHFLFENPLSKGGQYHLADIRHGNTQDQCMLVAEGANLANRHRLSLPDFSGTNTENLPAQQSFDHLIKRAVFGVDNGEDKNSPEV